MPNPRWDDDLLDLKFKDYDNQLEALRAVPMSAARLAIQQENTEAHLKSVSDNQKEIKQTCEAQGKDIGEIKVQLASLGTKIGIAGTIAGLVSGGLVTLVVILLTGHG
jgi:hypothetical protein